MAILLDTNIFLRLAQPHHPQSSVAVKAVRSLRAKSESVQITQQNLVEFWVVTTRPVAANGLGLAIEQVLAEVSSIKKLFVLRPKSHCTTFGKDWSETIESPRKMPMTPGWLQRWWLTKSIRFLHSKFRISYATARFG